ncbi:MAG: PIG-L family deacetylase, partial [Terriglobales bacterium]
MTIWAALLLCLSLAAQAPAPRQTAPAPTVSARQLPLDRGAAAVWQSLLKLHTRASLLLVVAHPDDEDGPMLTYESRGQGVRADLLTLNRGEGGQNLMSDDFYDALGLVRTQELLASDRYYGVQQFFTRVVDFGFSKTEAETLQKWGHERVLADAVRVVRMTRPLVVASVFVGGPSDGHGNHAAAGEIAQEVYDAAGDPNKFPEQIRAGLHPWKPRKVYARVPVYAFSPRGIYDSASQVFTPNHIFDYVHQTWIEGQPSVTLRIEDGGYDPVLGATYTQIAREGLAQQRSQLGGLALPDAGPSGTPYHLYASRVKTAAKEKTFFDGVDIALPGIADLAPGEDTQALRHGLQQLNSVVDEAMRQFRAADPAAIAPLLAQGLAQTNVLLAAVESGSLSPAAKYDIAHELRIKQSQFNNAIVQALGLQLSARLLPADGSRGGRGGPGATPTAIIPGQHFNVDGSLDNPSAQSITLDSITVATPAGETWQSSPPQAAGTTLHGNQPHSYRIAVTAPTNAGSTRPYYSRLDTEQPYYDLIRPQFLNLPEMPYPLAIWARMRYQGVAIALGQVVQSVAKVNGGVAENPLVVSPAISVTLSPRNGIIPLPAAAFPLTVTIHSNVPGAAAGTVVLRLPAGWSSQPATAPFDLQHGGEDQPIRFTVRPGEVSAQIYTITASASYNGRTYEEGYHTAGYAGLRPYNLYFPATYRTRGVSVKVARNLNVGYVPGTGDSVPQALQNLGIHVHLLSGADLASGNLGAYSVLVLGIRAYSARPDLRSYNARLLQYVHNGGVLIVQYQSSDFDHDFGPYPYHLGGNGATVVDEGSAVRLLAPRNPVLSWPNQITGADFADWVEERGHGFMA